MYLTQHVRLQTVGSVTIMIPPYARSVLMVTIALRQIRALVRCSFYSFYLNVQSIYNEVKHIYILSEDHRDLFSD